MHTNYFAEQGKDYGKARPAYPAELFVFLADKCERRSLAWDCATGTGQAAVELSKHFDRVIGTDISGEQIQNAVKGRNISYDVGAAESFSLLPGSVDLIVAAQAAPWLDLPRFFEHCRDVAAPNAILSLFGFRDVFVDEGVDKVLKHYFDLLETFWPQSSLVLNDSRYRCIEAPFEELASPQFEIKVSWNMKQVLGLLDSYSGSRAYLKETGGLPSQRVEGEMRTAWGDADVEKDIVVPMSFRLWRVNSTSR
jgi:hypothetical protein